MNDKKQKVTVFGVLQRADTVLMMRRAQDEEHYPGIYEFPGGHSEFGEDPEAALIREFKEETGMDVAVGDFIRAYSWVSEDETQHATALVYRVTESSEAAVKITDSHDDVKWVKDIDSVRESTLPDIITTFEMIIPPTSAPAEIPAQGDVIDTPNFKNLKVYTDGGSRGNPGPSASGYVIMTTDETIIEEGGEYLGITTNNQAEYQAVKLALEKAQKFSPEELHFFIDSLLVVNQMNGTWKVKNQDLWPVHEAIKTLVAGYDKVTFKHVRREYNTLADAQVNVVLDERQGK